MDEDQLIVFGNHIRTNTHPDVQEAVVLGDHNVIANWYNQTAIPDFWVFVSGMSSELLVASMDWATEYAVFKDDMTTISFLFQGGSYSPRSVNSRNALDTVFSGAPNSKQAILDAATRLAREVEVIFAETTTGPGGGDGSSKASSAIAVYEGTASSENVRIALEVTA